MPRAPRLPTGISANRHGFRVYVRVRGVLHTHRFPADTAIETMRAWRTKVRAQTTLRLFERAAPGTLAGDAQTYLQIVHAMPTIATRTVQIEKWVAALGPARDRHDVTSAEIAAQLTTWQREEHWKNGTVNRHRTALGHFYATLAGPRDVNPVRAVPKWREEGYEPKGLDYRLVQAVLDAMPGRDVVKAGRGTRRYAPSKARACLMVLAYVGMPPAQIRQLRPEHIDWKAKTILMPARRKGRGTTPRVRALTDQGVAALREFERCEAWGGVAGSTMLLVFRRALKVAKRQHRRWRWPARLTPYSFRHAFAELVYRTTRSVGITAGLLGHLDERTTRRYIGGAVEDVERAAAADVSAALALTPRLRPVPPR